MIFNQSGVEKKFTIIQKHNETVKGWQNSNAFLHKIMVLRQFATSFLKKRGM